MPRLQRRGDPRPGSPGGPSALAALLGAERFRLGPHTARVQANLERHGGLVDERAPAWIGADLPPHGSPSVSLGEARGTLGPHSFGFLDNVRGVAPLAAPLPSLPRRGSVAFVCARREALVDVGPLALARDLGVSWIISVGDGDPAEVLAFLAADAATRAILFAPGEGARPDALSAVGEKPVALLGGDPLLRAAVRRASGLATDDLEAWVAFGVLEEALAQGGARHVPRRPLALVAGGGGALVAREAKAQGLALPVVTVDDDDPRELERAIADLAPDVDLLFLAGSEATRALGATPTRPTLLLDPALPDRTRALLATLAQRLAPVPAPIPRVRADRPRAQQIVDENSGLLGDHDAKRVLHLYGARVSRQAPASSPTAALRVAQQLSYPVDVVVEPAASGRTRTATPPTVRRAFTAAELKRVAGVLLEQTPFVVVREAFELTPRAQLAVRDEPDVGFVLRAGDERALLPLDRTDAIHIARTVSGDDLRPLIDLLARATACAHELRLELELELYVGAEPAVVAASARRRPA